MRECHTDLIEDDKCVTVFVHESLKRARVEIQRLQVPPSTAEALECGPSSVSAGFAQQGLFADAA